MSDQVGVAIVGVGRWGIHLLRNFLENPLARVVVVVDPNPDNLTRAAEQFSLSDRVVLTRDFQTALQIEGIEAVAIATPAATHFSLITAALGQRLHVLAEKPLTLSVAESVQLCQLADQQHCQLVIDHTYLFHPDVLLGKAVIQDKELGDLRYGYAARTHLSPVRSDVDALWDLAIHDIAIFNEWLGAMPCQVQAKGTGWLQTDLSDVVWLTLTYPNGFEATIHLCWLNPDKQRRLSVVGCQGTLTFDELSPEPLSVRWGQLKQQEHHFNPANQRYERLTLLPIEPLQQVCDHFLTCALRNQPSNISSGWLGAELVQILVALSQSMKQGGKIVSLQPLAAAKLEEC
ncbi:MAG: Gfo/Idh/MocA family oxidoreductase [Phormidesmis sp. CAN_BIN36]|nr:Gfo/Idh/MocA family oxidoreductase [Phormidesmis sp. CAN_BIN36]